MRCDSCGAELPQGQSICEYCGSTWDQVVPATAVASSAGMNIFQQIKQSTLWTDRNSPYRQGSLPQMPFAASVVPTIILIAFIGVSAFMAFTIVGTAGMFGAVASSHGGLFRGLTLLPALMPAAFLVLGAVLIKKHRKTMNDYQNSPIVTHAAVIKGKRIEVSGGGQNTSAHTRYFLSAQFEDGRRTEFAVMAPALYGQVSEGDAGVLFVRSNYVLDFDRVVV